MAIEPRWANDAAGGTKLNFTRLNSYTPTRGDYTNPNGNVTGSPGDTYLNTIGGAGQTLWVKETGSGTNTGWVATGASSGSSGHTIQDEGTPLTARANLDFQGAGVTVTDNSGANKTVVTIPGGGGSTPDATTSSKGIVQLTNDLGGTAAAPTVPELANKADLVSGKIPTFELGTGTATSTTFLRGDQTWATPTAGSTSIVAAVRVVSDGHQLARSGPATIDGISLSDGNRVLFRLTGDPGGNGVYVVNTTGSWPRSADMAVGMTFQSGVTVDVTEGDTYGGTRFELVTVNGARTFTVANYPSGALLDVRPVIGVPPGFVQIQYNAGTHVFLIPAVGNYYVQVTQSSIVAIADPINPNSSSEINILVQMDSVGGKQIEFSPGSIAWDNGFIPSNQSASPFDLTANNLTWFRLKWMGPGFGWIGEQLTSIKPLVEPNVPTSWTNSESLGYGGINTQNLNSNIAFVRNFPTAHKALIYDALTQLFSAALRQRLLNNNVLIDVGCKYPTDGARGGFNRGGSEESGGYTITTPYGPVMAIQNPANAAGAKGLVAHEGCHSIDAWYYGIANSHPGSGIGNGSEPDQISSHSTLQTLHTDCVNNGVTGNPPANQYEWFAEMERARRLNDNGPLGTAGTSQTFQVGDKTNAGPGGSGGTPAQRQTRFNNYMISLGLV